MNFKEKVYTVGEYYNEFNISKEGAFLDFTSTGFVLCIFLKHFSEDDLSQFNSELKIRYIVINNVYYFLYLFGDMNWFDCPLLIKNKFPITLECINEKQGLSLTIFFINSEGGRLESVRSLKFSYSFSKTFLTWYSNSKLLTENEYNNEVEDTYSRFSSTDLAIKSEKSQCIFKRRIMKNGR